MYGFISGIEDSMEFKYTANNTSMKCRLFNLLEYFRYSNLLQ